MYPKKQPKSDREKFYGAFQKKVGCKPEQYLRRKLAGGMQEAELRRLYDMLAVEIAMKARCTAIRYDALQLEPAGETAAERHIRRAATHEVPHLRTLRRTHGAAHRTDRRAQGKEILGLLQLPGLPVHEGL